MHPLQVKGPQVVPDVPYMSPEQVTGDPRELDTCSDLYSLGVVLCELLSNRLPHDVRNWTIPEALRVMKDQGFTSQATNGLGRWRKLKGIA